VKDETRRTLRYFVEKAEELRNARLIRLIEDDGLKIKIAFNAADGEGLTIEYKDIDREALQAFSLTFRMFSEDTDVIALRKLSQIKDSDLSKTWKKNVTQVNQWWSRYIKGIPSPTFVLDSKHLTRKEILWTFMYGDLSHLNHREVFKDWEDQELLFPLLRNQFYLALVHFVRAVSHLARLAVEELTRQ
jgi:hypothetical protein